MECNRQSLISLKGIWLSLIFTKRPYKWVIVSSSNIIPAYTFGVVCLFLLVFIFSQIAHLFSGKVRIEDLSFKRILTQNCVCVTVLFLSISARVCEFTCKKYSALVGILIEFLSKQT